MNATSCDLYALLWSDDPARRLAAADNLQLATDLATEAVAVLLSAYVDSVRPDTGGLLDQILIKRAAGALHDVAGIAAELVTVRARLSVAADLSAREAEDARAKGA